ncbi:hypothetical protein DFQ27_009537 [Actinomortierella ambigua]|uniref:Carbonic anhydrase n=1 Tax=Actinomortierella ambigua TaxID=1343610 RepID=A0A9P6QEJ4_9FUNG|nr:hypothetical protein DFQ27_009537 [Actinomortierella ambigua]
MTIAHETPVVAEVHDDGHSSAIPKRKVAIVTCMDARMLTDKIFELEKGDAHVIRNAGGRASEALRSLIISEQLLGTEKIIIAQHTDCGMQKFTNDELHARMKTEMGVDSSQIDFLPFKDLEQNVRDDMQLLRDSKYIPKHIQITGFIYNVKDEVLVPVKSHAV